MGKKYPGAMSQVLEFAYKHFLVSEIWGDDSLCNLLGGVSWKYYYCSKCGGEYRVVKIIRDEIAECHRHRDAVVECKDCGNKTEMGFTFPIKQ